MQSKQKLYTKVRLILNICYVKSTWTAELIPHEIVSRQIL